MVTLTYIYIWHYLEGGGLVNKSNKVEKKGNKKQEIRGIMMLYMGGGD